MGHTLSYKRSYYVYSNTNEEIRVFKHGSLRFYDIEMIVQLFLDCYLLVLFTSVMIVCFT